MPVFSFPEEAELFLCCETQEDGWRVRESDPDELLFVFSGPCADVKSVALDPLPDMVAGATLALVSISQREFTERLINGRAYRENISTA